MQVQTLTALRDRVTKMERSHLENLNPEQLRGVTHHLGPILILAGAGTGKTRVLTRRIANLVLEQKVRPSSILAVTFTNKAAGEMRERLHKLLGDRADDLWISTFHSAGLRILRRTAQKLGYKNDFVVYDDQDTKELLKAIIKEKNIDEKRYSASFFSKIIDQAKNEAISPEEFAKRSSSNKNGAYDSSLQAEVYDLYQRRLVASNAMDFGDLLANTARLFNEFPDVLKHYQHALDFILVDEFQDTNVVQYDIVRRLAGSKKNLFVVGDDDQSIYAFRGATIRNILDFERDFPGTTIVTLEQNYRSTANILDGAHGVIEKNRQRKPKKLWTSGAPGDGIRCFCGSTEEQEAEYVGQQVQECLGSGMDLKDIAIFYRTNAQSRALEEAFVRRKIPYRIFGGLKFYDRKEIKDILAYLRLIVNPADGQAFHRVINTPTRGIGAQAVQSIASIALSSGASMYEAAKVFSESNKSVRGFVELIEGFQAMVQKLPISELLREIIEKSTYGPRLKEMKNDVTATSRLENIFELVGIAAELEFSGKKTEELIRELLDRVALTSSTDISTDESGATKRDAANAVSLMTLHLCKGLEFDAVFFTGLEEGLVPHYRSMFDPIAVEEERRLCYVGMTRARQILYLTRAERRGMFSAGGELGGMGQYRDPSRFTFDIPKGVLQNGGGPFFDSAEAYLDRRAAELLEEESKRSQNSGLKNNSLEDFGASKKARRSPADLSSLLKSGDDLVSGEMKELLAKLSNLSAENAIVGRPVVHPSFGKGIIEKTEGKPSNKEKSFKVAVKFEKFTEPKKLVFIFAGLRDAQI